MKYSELLNEIRLIIREEVKTALLQNELLQERKQFKQVNLASSTPKRALKTPIKASTPKQEINYSSNPLLNQILNETATSKVSYMDSMIDEYEEWPTMNYNINSRMPVMNTQHNVIPTTDLDGRPVDVTNLDPGVEKALTKDYSALMKAINKKKGLR